MRSTEVSWSSSAVLYCITRCARFVSFQRLGSSARAFSSSSRRRALSTSKMPPQQPDRLLDVIDDLLDFGAHCHSLAFGKAHVAARAPLRKPWPSFTRRGRLLG